MNKLIGFPYKLDYMRRTELKLKYICGYTKIKKTKRYTVYSTNTKRFYIFYKGLYLKLGKIKDLNTFTIDEIRLTNVKLKQINKKLEYKFCNCFADIGYFLQSINPDTDLYCKPVAKNCHYVFYVNKHVKNIKKYIMVFGITIKIPLPINFDEGAVFVDRYK